MEPASSTQALLDQLLAGNDAARATLLLHCQDRLRHMAHLMFRRHQDLRALEETDDVLQRALVRLYRALAKVQPTTVRGLYGLAAQQIRWVLCDLAREAEPLKAMTCTGSSVPGKDGFAEPTDPGGEPGTVLAWCEFHQKIESLPAEQRELFDLLFYQGLEQAEAAALLGVPLRTLKRHWQKAKLALRDALHGNWPGDF